MARRKKTFPCGHQGFGQTCHRCAQLVQSQESQKQADEEKRQAKLAWEATFADDVIDLRKLPKQVVLKARQILTGLANQQNYHEYGGKRLRHDRRIISIPVGYDYRLLCREEEARIIPTVVISHEDYNKTKPGT